MKRILAAGICAALLAGCAGGPPRVQSNETLERYISYAGEPVDRFTSFSLDSWESVDSDHIVLRTGVNDAYLVTVWNTCPDLRFANTIRVVSTMSSSISRFDKVKVGRDTCPIREIRPIDVRQMKADIALAKLQKKQEKQAQQ